MLWLCAGIIFSLSVSAMWVSGKWNPDCFWDVGQVYDCWYPEKNTDWKGTVVDEDGNFQITADIAHHSVNVGNPECEWKYLLVDIENMSSENMVWNIKLTDNGSVISEQDMVLYGGVNCFELEQVGVEGLIIGISGHNGNSFSISKMQLYERFPDYSLKTLAVRAAVIFLLWMCAAILIWKKAWRFPVNWYVPIDVLQRIYLTAWQKLHPQEWKLTEKKRSFIRRGCFLFMIVFANAADLAVGYTKAYRWTAIVTLICLWGMAFVSMKGRPVNLNWRCRTVYGWFYFSALALVSELLITHRNGYVGGLLLAGFGFLYFVLANTGGWNCFVADIAAVVEFTFWGSTLFCILCRQYHAGYAYLGPCTNSAVYAMYLVVVLVTFLGKLERQYKEHAGILGYMLTAVGIGSCICLLNLTSSRTSVVAVAAVLLWFLYHAGKNVRLAWRKKMIVVFCGLSVMCAAGVGTAYMVAGVPKLLGTGIVFRSDAYEISGSGQQGASVAQAAQREPQIKYQIQKMWDKVDYASSARLTIWKDYVREMNLLGHEDRPIVRNRRENPHNGVIAAGYRYGITAVLPYCVMIAGVLGRSLKMGRRNDAGSFLLPGYVMAIVIISMLDNVETPLRWLLWFLLYLLCGCVFPEKEKDFTV